MVSLLADVDLSTFINSQNAIPLAGICIGLLIPVFVIGFSTWRRVKNHAGDVLLKRDLIARGYSADEIERIVQVSAKGNEKD